MQDEKVKALNKRKIAGEYFEKKLFFIQVVLGCTIYN